MNKIIQLSDFPKYREFATEVAEEIIKTEDELKEARTSVLNSLQEPSEESIIKWALLLSKKKAYDSILNMVDAYAIEEDSIEEDSDEAFDAEYEDLLNYEEDEVNS